MELGYSYLPCRFCVGKMHCSQCGEEICEAIRPLPGVLSARADAEREDKRLFVELAPGADEDTVFDALEAVGVFV